MSDTLKHATYDTRNRKTKQMPIQLYPADAEMLDLIVEYLGCSRSEAVRSAIRIMASQLPLRGRKRGVATPTL